MGTSGILYFHPDRIALIFRNYFSDLYNNPSIPRLSVQNSFYDRVRTYLASSGVTTLSTTALQSLNSPITKEEVSETLKHLPNCKASGPDGLPYEYYKTFLTTLLPHMTHLFNRFMQGGKILWDIQTSHLTLILKPDKAHTLWGNYRPIALLNSDLKIFMKLLSLHLN